MNRSHQRSPQQSSSTEQLTLHPIHYRQLTQALSPTQMATYLAETLVPPGSSQATKPPVCHVLDMKYAPNERCTLLYQWGEQLLIGLLEWEHALTAPPGSCSLHCPARPVALPLSP